MKKAILFFVFLFVAALATSNAQCSSANAGAQKSCCAGKISKAAAADPSIEKRMADNGTVSYVRKEADAQGNVKFVSVQFDEANNAFVNVAPKTATAEVGVSGMTKKSCSAGAAGTGKSCSGAAAGTGKACCASKAGAEGKACADKKVEQD